MRLSLGDAFTLTDRFLAGKIDQDGYPATWHAYRVAARGQTTEEQVVGALHDLLEETTCTIKDLEAAGFDEEIVAAVITLTRDKNLETYRQYIERVTSNGLATRVKLHDLDDNIQRCYANLPKYHSLLVRYLKAQTFLQRVSHARGNW